MTFYKNGDRYFKGVRIQLTPQRYLNFSHLLSDLTKWISLPYGVRRLYSCEVNLHIWLFCTVLTVLYSVSSADVLILHNVFVADYNLTRVGVVVVVVVVVVVYFFAMG